MIFPLAACLAAMAQAPIPSPPEHPAIPQLYQRPYYGPSFVELTFRERVAPTPGHASGQVDMPFPSEYNGQHVISLKLESDPPDTIKGWSLKRLPDGENQVLQVEVAPPATGAEISWTIRAVAPLDTIYRTQKRDFETWRISTPPSPVFRAATARAVKDIRQSPLEKDDIAGAAAMWAARYKGGWSSAKETAGAPGSDALNRALLCVAILQALDIPARVAAYVPITLGPQAIPLWLVEYRTREGAWDMVEPTVGIKEPVRSSILYLEIPPPEELRRLLAAAPGNQDPALVAPAGVSPELRLTPAAGELTILKFEQYPWQSGARLMLGARVRSRKVLENAAQGKEDWIDDAVFQAAFQKGPTNLALFLSGRPTFPDRPKG